MLKYKNRFFQILLLGIFVLIVAYACAPKKNKKFVIARDDTWYPVDLHGKERNLLGFTNELIQDIAKTQDLQIDLILVTGNNNLQQGLDNRSYDGMLSSLRPTARTQSEYYFSEPFFLLGPVLVVNAESAIHSLKEMEGKSLGIISGSSVIFNVEEYPTILITSYDSAAAALYSLERGNVDGIILDGLSAHSYTSGLYARTIKIASKPLTNDGFRLVTLKKSSEKTLVDQFNQGLNEMISNGTYDLLIKKWELFNTL